MKIYARISTRNNLRFYYAQEYRTDDVGQGFLEAIEVVNKLAVRFLIE